MIAEVTLNADHKRHDAASELTRLPASYSLSEFWSLLRDERDCTLVDAILRTHTWHYEKNRAYRSAVSAMGVGPGAGAADLPPCCGRPPRRSSPTGARPGRR